MRARLVSAVLAALAVGAGIGYASPAEDTPVAAVPTIEVRDVLPHLEKLQSIADSSGGNRAAGSEGYARSVDYVANTLTAAGFRVHRQRCTSCTKSDESVIADWPGGDEDSTILFGAHLDSVAAGPGIDDDGSGTAALLQSALTLAKAKPELARHLRFAWWADEEQEDDASSYYVEHSGTDDLAGYVNLDMVASPNAGYFLTYPDSELGTAMAGYFRTVGRAPEKMAAGCDCSDDAAFDDADVPTTYFSTASNDEDNMTDEQAEKWHGTAGKPYDACYHSKCDSFPGNINNDVLGYSSNAILHAMWTLAVRS